jgi:hypothetical protein
MNIFDGTTRIHDSGVIKHRQGYDHMRTIELADGRKVRTQVHIDTSYDFQSHAKSELWTANGWQEVGKWMGGDPVLKGPSVFSDEHLPKAETFIAKLVEEMFRITFAVID